MLSAVYSSSKTPKSCAKNSLPYQKVLLCYLFRKFSSTQRLRCIFWRRYIVNSATKAILRKARSHVSHRDESLPYTEYRQGDSKNKSGFFALLGCPNGSGVIRMIIDHCNALGHKTIASLGMVDLNSPPMMYFVLADRGPPPKDTLSYWQAQLKHGSLSNLLLLRAFYKGLLQP